MRAELIVSKSKIILLLLHVLNLGLTVYVTTCVPSTGYVSVSNVCLYVSDRVQLSIQVTYGHVLRQDCSIGKNQRAC